MKEGSLMVKQKVDVFEEDFESPDILEVTNELVNEVKDTDVLEMLEANRDSRIDEVTHVEEMAYIIDKLEES